MANLLFILCGIQNFFDYRGDCAARPYDVLEIAEKLVLRHVGACSDTYRAASATITRADAVRGIIALGGGD